MEKNEKSETFGDILDKVKARTLDPINHSKLEIAKFAIQLCAIYLAATPENAAVIIALWMILLMTRGLFKEDKYFGFYSPEVKQKINLISNLHYYCQVTGEYNEADCNLWKAKRASTPPQK